MKEILKGKIQDKRYEPYINKNEVIRLVHIYYDEETKVVYIDAPLKVKHLLKIRYLLWFENIEYSDIIVGSPDL